MSNHNICFRREIRKVFTRYAPLSRSMAVVGLISFGPSILEAS